MKITKLEAYTVALPFRAPLISAFGISYPARIRTFIRLHTDVGLVGLGETGSSALHRVERTHMLTYFEKVATPAVVGASPYDHQMLLRKLGWHPYSLAIELACWDLMARAADVPLYRFLGADAACERVPLAGYCFFRAPDADGQHAVTLDSFVAHCVALRERYGFDVLKLKLGGHHPYDEVPLVQQLRATVGPKVGLRIDPNGSWSLPTALRVLKRLEPTDLEYIEEPVRLLGPADGTTPTNALRRLRNISQTPIAADHAYRADLLAQIIREDAADVVLADLYGSGGIARTLAFARTATMFGLGVALHSGTETDIGQVAKLHIQAALGASMRYASDAIYPEYTASVLSGGPLKIADGHMAVPPGVGFGVTLDDDALARYELTAERHQGFDAFWQHTQAQQGIGAPSEDMLTRHY